MKTTARSNSSGSLILMKQHKTYIPDFAHNILIVPRKLNHHSTNICSNVLNTSYIKNSYNTVQ